MNTLLLLALSAAFAVPQSAERVLIDRVRVGGISSASFISAAFTSAKEDIRRAAAGVFASPAEHRYGPSPIWDAIAYAIDVLENEPGRRVIVAHTDGISTGDRLRRQDVVVRAAAADVTLMFVAASGPRADANLRAAAYSTGGTFLLGFGHGLRDPATPRLVESFKEVLTHARRARRRALSRRARAPDLSRPKNRDCPCFQFQYL